MREQPTFEAITYGDEYDPHGVDLTARLVSCSLCGAAVAADLADKHRDFHDRVLYQEET